MSLSLDLKSYAIDQLQCHKNKHTWMKDFPVENTKLWLLALAAQQLEEEVEDLGYQLKEAYEVNNR